MTATELAKLLPCPFCGHEAEILRFGDRSKSTQYNCTMCGCFLETGEEWNHGATWNRRAPDLAADNLRLTARIAALESLVQRLDEARGVLHFYADFHENPNDGPWGINSQDFGEAARAFLAGGAA
jgi:hypothetical protein